MADSGTPTFALREKIPVTIITGFLGAGKTTLLNYMLKARANKSIAVIENEFGEVNIDKELVADNLIEKEDIVSLSNGCVCCSLRKDIVRALAEIERRAKQRQKKVDAVLLETTGLADPAPVAFTFFANPWVAARFKLDSILCVVDAQYLLKHIVNTKEDGDVCEAEHQLAFADLILLNKVDLVSPEQLEQVRAAVRTINATASVIECQLNNTDVPKPPLDTLLDVDRFSVARAVEVDPTFLDSDSDPEDAYRSGQASTSKESTQSQAEYCGSECDLCAPSDLTKGERHPKRRRKRLHDLSGVASVGVVARGALDEYRFNMFMRDLLAEKARDIIRCKGVLCVHGYGNQKFVFQGVHETICYGPAEKHFVDGEPKLNKIVFIGRHLNRKALVEGFRTCIWVPLPDGWEEFRDHVTKTPYYFNRSTGEKTWTRPQYACPHVTSTELSAQQPSSMLPKEARQGQTS